MRFHEILHESDAPTVVANLLAKGYKVIGTGNYTKVFAKDNEDTVLRVGDRGDCWERFAKMAKGSDNPYLPRITRLGIHQGLLIARMERLKPIGSEMFDAKYPEVFAYIGLYVTKSLISGKSDGATLIVRQLMWKQDGRQRPPPDEIREFAERLVRRIDPRLATALDMITKLGCMLDLHPGNFMRRDDGTLVIVDPVSFTLD